MPAVTPIVLDPSPEGTLFPTPGNSVTVYPSRLHRRRRSRAVIIAAVIAAAVVATFTVFLWPKPSEAGPTALPSAAGQVVRVNGGAVR